MAFFRFLRTPAGRTLRIVTGLLLLAFGAFSYSLGGIVALMAGVAAIVTGFARLPHVPPGNLPRDPDYITRSISKGTES